MRALLFTALFVTGCQILIPVEERMPDASVPADAGGAGDGGIDAGMDAGTDAGTSLSLRNPTSVSFEGTVHLFAYDSRNRDLMWCPNANAGAAGCNWQAIDGAGGADVGAECISAIVWNSAIHLFYRQDTPPDRHVLRHGLFANGSWSFENIDGEGGISHGRTANRVGGCPSASSFPPWLFISFYDYDTRDLRIGWYSGQTWDFTPLDGSGGADGRITADVGYWSAQTVSNGVLHIFYSDGTNEDLREAFWNGVASTGWQMATRDGQAQAITGPIAAITHRGTPHVFYANATAGTLLHAYDTATWSTEVLDGDSTTGGRTMNDVGSGGISVASTPSALHVSYYDRTAGDLRRAWWGGSASWSYETADGDSQTGHLDADVGRNSTSVATGDRVDTFYEAPSASVRNTSFSYAQVSDGGCALAPSGVVAWWDGSTSGQTARDIWGPFHGTAIGNVTLPAGRVGTGFGFDGTSMIEVPVNAALAPRSAMTIELWLQLTGPQTLWARIVAVNEENNLPASSWTLGVGSHRGAFFCLSRAPLQTIIDGVTPYATGWTHVAATWDGVVQRIYLDGVLQPEQAALTGPLNAPSAPLRIGKGSTSFYGMVGMVDEVTLYDRALSATEIAAIASAGAYGKCK